MGLQRNRTGQNVTVFCFDKTTNSPVTGAQASITVRIDKDDAGFGAVTNAVVELEGGYYQVELTAAETQCHRIRVVGSHTNADYEVIGSPATIFMYPRYFSGLGMQAATFSNTNDGKLDTVVTAEGVLNDVGGNVVGSVGSVTGAVGSVTGNVGGSVASVAAINTTGGAIDNVTTTGTVTNPVTAGTVTDKSGYTISGTITTLDGLENISTSDVDTSVNNGLNTMFKSATTEATGVPSATATVLDQISYLFSGHRNEITVGAANKVFKTSAGATLFTKALSDDGSTYTEAAAS